MSLGTILLIVLILALVALEWQVAARAVPNRLNSALP